MTSVLAIGVDQKGFAKLEAALDTLQAFGAGDAIPHLELKIAPALKYSRSKEHQGTASQTGEIKGLSGGKWSCKIYVKLNAAGTAPVGEALFAAAYGASSAIVGGTSATHSLAPVVKSLQLAVHAGDGLYQVVTGAIVEDVLWEVVGNGEATVTFSGSFCSDGWVYAGAVTTATVTSGASSFTLAAAHRGKIGTRGRIKIGTDDNSGAGYAVTSHDSTTGVIGFSPNLGTTQTGATAITAFSPTPTYAGAIQGAIDCALSIGGTAIGLISGKVALKTGNRLLDKEASIHKPNRTSRSPREVTAEFVVYLIDDENAATIGKTRDGTGAAFALRIGPATSPNLTLNMPSGRAEVGEITLPDAEEATFLMKVVAQKSAANDDELNQVAA